MARIFITGDCHASYTKLGLKSFPESRNLTKDDYVIICGDFITIHGKRKARIYH